MPLISTLSEPEIKRILGEYGFKELRNFKEFSQGIENTNIKVKTEKGVFVLRQWAKAKKQNVAFELSLIKELKKKGFPVPRPFKALNGREILSLNGKPIALFEFLPGKSLEYNELNPEYLREIGKTLAGMQLALKDFKPVGKSEKKDLFDFGFDYYLIERVFPKLKGMQCPLAKEIEEEIMELKAKLRKPRKRIRFGPIHNDFYYWNLKFKNNKISAILDFGDACIGSWASDLAAALADNACNKRVKENAIKAIMNGYAKCIILNKSEKKVIPLLMLHRAVQVLLFEIEGFVEQPKNKGIYSKYIESDWKTIIAIKKAIPRIRETIESIEKGE